MNIAKDKFPAQFAADVPADQARLMAATQRPARRAGAKKTIEVPGASHVVMVSHPDAVARLIDDAATAATAAKRTSNGK
jgi:pimeloyl-ACP methyl ester carboxylesterase